MVAAACVEFIAGALRENPCRLQVVHIDRRAHVYR